MKKVLVITLLFSLLFPSVVFAESGNACGSVLTEDNQQQVQKFQDKDSSLQEAYIIDIVQIIWNTVSINTLNTLVFGNPFCIWYGDSDSELVFGVFTEVQKEKIIDPIFNLFTGLFTFALVISMMLTGLRMGLKTFGSRVAFTEELWMYIVVCILMISYWLGIEQILNLNFAITGSFKSLLLSLGVDLSGASIMTKPDDFNFTDVIILFAEWLLMLFLNFVYIVRSFMIMILMGLGGLAIISLLFQSTRSYFSTWLQDFVGTLFVQSIHAFYLTIVLLFVTQLEGEMAVLIKLGLLILFLPLTSAVMNWMNLSSGELANQVGMTGVNSIAGAVSMSRKVKAMSNSKKMPKAQDLSNLKTTRISSTSSGSGLKSWQTAKSVSAKVGMVVGAAAGSVLGPGGMVIGGSIGSKGAGALLQGPRNVAGGIKGAVNTINGVKQDGFKNVMGDLHKRRMAFGDMGESMGAMVGAGAAGRSVGNGLSGVSRQRLANSTEKGGLGGNSIASLAKQNPGANLTFMQNNQGSGFYLNDKGQMQLVSPIGAADTNLLNGEMRKVDYQLGSSDMQANSSGQYSMNRVGQGSLTQTSEAYLQSAGGKKYNDPGFNTSSIVPDNYYKSGMKGSEQRDMSDHVADRVARHPGFV